MQCLLLSKPAFVYGKLDALAIGAIMAISLMGLVLGHNKLQHKAQASHLLTSAMWHT
jgi:hypothetical protein